MSFLTKVSIMILAEEDEEDKKYSEKEAIKLLKEDPKVRRAKFSELISVISDPNFLKDLWRTMLHDPNEENSIEYFSRKELVDKVIELAPKDIAFFVEVMKKEDEDYVWNTAFEQLKEIGKENEKSFQKAMTEVSKGAHDINAAQVAKVEIADQKELKKIALSKKTGDDVRVEAIKRIDDQKWLIQLFSKVKEEDAARRKGKGYETADALLKAVVSQIKDQTFLKSIIKHKDYRYTLLDLAMENITDQKYLLNLAQKAEDPHTIEHAIKKINDVDKLKELYQAYAEKQVGKKGWQNKQWLELRSAMLKRISALDKDFMVEMILKEKKMPLRMAALDQITDQDTIKSLINSKKLNAEVRDAAILKSTDEEFLRKLALEGELPMAQTALQRLMVISPSDQDTFISFYEKHPEQEKQIDSYKLRKYFEKSANPEKFYKRILNSKTFPSKERETLVNWEFKELKDDCREYLMTTNDRGHRYDSILPIYIRNVSDEDPAEKDQEFLQQAFSSTSEQTNLVLLTPYLHSKFIFDSLADRKDIPEYARKNVYSKMKIDEYALNKITTEETSPKVLSEVFNNIKEGVIDDDVLIKTIQKLPPDNIEESRYSDGKKDYRQKLLDLVKDTALLMGIAKDDPSELLRYRAYYRMDSKDGWRQAASDPSAQIRWKALTNLHDSPDTALKIYKSDPEIRNKQEAVLWVSPDDFTEDMIPDFKVGLKATQFPNAVSLDLKVKGYKIATNEEDKKYFASMLPKRLIDPEHRTGDPSFDEADERRGERVEHSVPNPQTQLYRLLLTYARPPGEKQKSAASLSEFWAMTCEKYRLA